MKTVNPKKKFGQNFLNDNSIATQIVGFLSIEKTNNIIEVGPGMGILTKAILKINNLNKKFIELDKECCGYLLNNFSEIEKDLINDDFLKFDIKKFNPPVSIIGNFPYNISSQILFKIFENKEIIYEMIGMFQYEVAERICSNKGTKKYGILSVLIQAFFSVELLIKIKPESFNPPPKVNSAVIRIKKVRDKIDCDEILFKQIIKSAFNQRRKTLRNSLKSFKKIENIKEHSIFDKRAEELDVDDYIFLTNLLSNGNI
ncbi:MAG: ribosomal RNA small subunit methyltransferase A [Flavobacteriaceae bacterium]|nr:ribosomal RNA small subunit methyltransferase A [Flavobacteriaceae bacterium]MBL6685076.1 ribosomal RNA small subunit methyltransferase A [Flavobacteriaceae bacterium]